MTRDGLVLDMPHSQMRSVIFAYRKEWQRGKCAYCGGPIDEPVRFPPGWTVPFGGALDIWGPNNSPHQPSLDHMVPRAQGGRVVGANLRVVHLACNYDRSASDRKE